MDIALTVMLATFMEVLDTSVANVALPQSRATSRPATDESTWMLTSYLVRTPSSCRWAAGSPLDRPQALLHDVRGDVHRQFILVRHGSHSRHADLFRVLQGIGGGALQPVSQAIWWRAFREEKQGMAMAVYGMGVVVAPVIGPTLGGWITDNYTWRWIFLINIPVGILSLVLTSLLIFDPRI